MIFSKRLSAKPDPWLASLKPPGPPQALAAHRGQGFIKAEILPGN